MRTPLKLCATAGLLICAASCKSPVVVIDTASDVVRLDAPAAAAVSIWRGGTWQHVGKMTLPAGWYAGPGPL